MSPSLFVDHLAYLSAQGLGFLTQQQAVGRVRSGDNRPWVGIGFDDGYEDNYSVVLPILEHFGIKATFYIVSGQIGEGNRIADSGYQLYEGYRMVNNTQIREISESGHEVASHGLQHELATSVLAEKRDLTAELAQSREELSRLASAEIVSHAYPNGQRGSFSKGTCESVRNAGFLSSATTVWGRLTPGSDAFALPRCEVSMRDTVSTIREKMTGRRDYLSIAHRIRQSPTWNE